jgi:hypothetical protein
MNADQRAERKLLRLASEKGKFVVSITAAMTEETQGALERLQLREWIRLIDVTPIGPKPRLYRVFLLTKPALEFLSRTADA